MNKIVNKILSVLVLLPAILFLVTGLRWLVDPAGVAPEFGLVLGDVPRGTRVGQNFALSSVDHDVGRGTGEWRR